MLGEAQPKLTPLAGCLGCNDSESGGHCSFAEQAKVHDVLSEILDANQGQNYLSYADTLNENRIEASVTRAYGNDLQYLIVVSEAQKPLVFEYFHARQPSYEAS